MIVPVPLGTVSSTTAEPQSVTIRPATSGFGGALVAQRAANGVGGVEENAILTQVANAYAERQARAGTLVHDADGMPWDRAQRAGYCSAFVGENLGNGLNSETEALAAWMNSPGHRANILNPKFVRYGLGHFADTWVLMLGGAC